MNLRNILIATDFSEAGTSAFAEAARWAQRYRTALHVIHVVPPKRWFGGLFGLSDSVHATACELAAKSLKNVVARVDGERILHISTSVREGTAAKSIARAAQELGADLLVIGARGEHQSAAAWMSLGGTAAKLMDMAAVPTLLVRREPAITPPVVLAPVDLTPVSTSVLQWAFRCCHEGELRVLHEYEIPFSGRLRTYGVAESAINVYAAGEHARRSGELSDLIKRASPPSTVRIQATVERVESSEILFDHIRHFTGTTLVLGKHSPDFERPGPNYDSVCHFAARVCPTNVLIVPPPGRGE